MIRIALLPLAVLVVSMLAIGYYLGTKHYPNEKDPCAAKINSMQNKIDSLSAVRSSIPYHYTPEYRTGFFDSYLEFREGSKSK